MTAAVHPARPHGQAPGPDPAPATGPGFRPDQLAGFRIGVTSDRRSADLVDALERRGASVLHAPTLRIAPAAHDDELVASTHAVVAARPDGLLVTTSYGLRRWLEVADATGDGPALLEALHRAEILVRGPKARGAVRAAGLADVGVSREETTASLVTTALERWDPPGTVVVQLHGQRDETQLARLREAGFTVLVVEPYRWLPPQDPERVRRLVDAVAARQLDAVTFTSAPAVEAFLAAARELGLGGEVADALRTEVLAAPVGPVTAAPLVAIGVPVAQPERFRMGALVKHLCDELPTHRVRRVETAQGPLELRGELVRFHGTSTTLTPTPLALLRTLVDAGGAVVSRRRLARALPGTADEHAVEMALSRLRTALGSRGLVQTVIKRGYRLDVLPDDGARGTAAPR